MLVSWVLRLLRFNRMHGFSLNKDKLKLSMLKTGAMAGADRIVAYCSKNTLSREHTAYILATVYHETAGWMQPIREGASRYGPNYSDANARQAVANLFARGLIRVNYARPDPVTGKSYYGRGLVQITWKENYAKFSKLLGIDLVGNPDLALDWDTSLHILVEGMRLGLFRAGHSLKQLTAHTFDQFYRAREIINGDTKKNGTMIADYARKFYDALEERK